MTHLPKEVRDVVAKALKGESLVSVKRIAVDNIHSYGGCIVLEDAARRYRLSTLLAPLSQRNASLIQALIFGGLLFPPSVAPFHLESRHVRLAAFCGLDHEHERFDLADLSAALKELDEKWPQIRATVTGGQHDVREIVLFKLPPADSHGNSHTNSHFELGAIGIDSDGIPVPLPLPVEWTAGADFAAFLQEAAQASKGTPPLVAADEAIANRAGLEKMERQPYLIQLGHDSVAVICRQLNQAHLMEALRTGGPVEIRHQGKRHLLGPVIMPRRTDPHEATLRMGSLKELTSITAGLEEIGGQQEIEPDEHGAAPATAFQAVRTNVSADRLTPERALEWAYRARLARAAFCPVQIINEPPAPGETAIAWRNHKNLQFLTHWLRCHMHADWSAKGETRPVEEVLRDLQEVHRATLTVEGIAIRQMASHPPQAVAALLDRLNLWALFE